MMGGKTTIIILPSALVAMIFVAATLAQGIRDEDTSNIFGPLEVTKGELESNRLYRKDVQLERVEKGQHEEEEEEEGGGGASPSVRIQDEGALAAVVGTRRRGSLNATVSKYPSRRGCVTEGAVFAEGSAMVSPDECSYCFCIRGRQRCVAPKCLLPVEGCRPRYRTFSCCPAYYDCHDASTTTTTTTRTPRDCEVDGVRYAAGALIEGAGGDCENCYCLNGEVTCSRTTCAPPLDGCKPVMQEGHCCPVKYDCDDGNRRVSVDQIFKDFPIKIVTADQKREFERLKPEWQTNMARKAQGGEAIIADPTDGQSFQESFTEAPLEIPDTQAPPVDKVKEETPAGENNKQSPSKPEEDETNDNKRNKESPTRRTPDRGPQRKRFSSLITRPSREELTNMRKQSRYPSDRRPAVQRPRIQTQSLSSRLRQRIKQNKDQRNDNNNEETETSSTSTTTTTTITTTTTSTTTPTTTTTPPSSTTQTATLLSSDSTTSPLPASTTQDTFSENEEFTMDTTIYDDSDPVTDGYEDITTLAYDGPVPGIFDAQDIIYDSVALDSEVPVDTLLLKPTSTSVETPTEEVLSVDVSPTSAQVFEPTTTAKSRTTARASRFRFTTSTTSTTTEETPLPEVFEFGHPGEAFLVEDISEMTSPKPTRGSAFKINEQIAVGTGVNVKGNLEDAVRYGPILIFDNRVRADRQQKDANATEPEEESTPQVEEELTAATDIPEETTILAREDIINDEKIFVDETGLEGELLSTDYDEGTEEVTTLFPTLALFQDTTIRSLSEILSSTTESPSINETDSNVHADYPSTALDDIEYHYGDETDYTDIETDFPSYDITVGTSVLANSHGPPQSTGIGEVIPVELEPEHKSPEIEPEHKFPEIEPEHKSPEIEPEHKSPEMEPEHKTPDTDEPLEEAERPSLLGTILNILTRTERPRPERLDNLPPPPPPPFRPPYRTRPRPDSRPNTRPDFIPPRLRFTPPPPPLAAGERDTTEESDFNLLTSPPAPLSAPTSRPTIFEPPPPPEPPKNVINRPALGPNRPRPISNSPVHSSNHPDLPIRPDFSRPHTVVNRPIAPPPPPQDNPHGLPSIPIIESGFQGMKDEEGIPPNIDLGDYDIDGEPTLPPSLPNLKIIPFVAADAVVNQEIGIAGDEFKAPPLLLTDSADENNDNLKSDDTTEPPTTTSRRPQFTTRRSPILPPRRPILRPGDETSNRRPFPFRRPGDRPTRPPFSTKTTAPATLTEDHAEEEEDLTDTRLDIPFSHREHPSTRPPFIPPRRPTHTTEDSVTTTIIPPIIPITTTTTTTRRPPPVNTTPKTIVSDDIANLLLQDVFGLSQGQNTPPVRFAPARTSPKPIIPVKETPLLPEIPSAVKEQLPLATDPVLASGLLKLSGCNIYGRMYRVGAKIKELSASCKECRCTPVGVQCLPIC